MNLIYQLRNLFTPHRETALPTPATSYKELLSNLDELCTRLPDGEAAEDHAVQSQDLLSYAAPDFRMLSLPDDNPALFLCYGNQVQAAGAMKLFQQPVSGGRTRIDSTVLRTERAQSQIQCIR